jgi:transcriptional regulator with XRE-family HTH domain
MSSIIFYGMALNFFYEVDRVPPMAPVPKPKRVRQKHFFREWREKLDLTQETAINRLGWTQSKLSRIEAGKTPYNQDDLEALEEAYGVSKESLLSVNPFKQGLVVDIMNLIKDRDPDLVRRVIEALPKRA